MRSRHLETQRVIRGQYDLPQLQTTAEANKGKCLGRVPTAQSREASSQPGPVTIRYTVHNKYDRHPSKLTNTAFVATILHTTANHSCNKLWSTKELVSTEQQPSYCKRVVAPQPRNPAASCHSQQRNISVTCSPCLYLHNC